MFVGCLLDVCGIFVGCLFNVRGMFVVYSLIAGIEPD